MYKVLLRCLNSILVCFVASHDLYPSIIYPPVLTTHRTPYTPLQLQFVSKTDIDTMSSDIAMFIAAAATGDKKTIQQMLKEKKVTNVNDRDWDQLTALIPAAQGGHLDIVKLLIKEVSKLAVFLAHYKNIALFDMFCTVLILFKLYSLVIMFCLIFVLVIH